MNKIPTQYILIPTKCCDVSNTELPKSTTFKQGFKKVT